MKLIKNDYGHINLGDRYYLNFTNFIDKNQYYNEKNLVAISSYSLTSSFLSVTDCFLWAEWILATHIIASAFIYNILWHISFN